MKRLLLLVLVSFTVLWTAGCGDAEGLWGSVSLPDKIEAAGTFSELPVRMPQKEELSVSKPEKTEITLPKSYSYQEEGRMPVPRDQGDENSCWAYASMSALESSWDQDAKGPYATEHLLQNHPFGRELSEGGSYAVSMAYLLSWLGPVEEKTEESSEDPLVCVHVQEVRQAQPKDYEAIKRFVYKYGGVETALYVDFRNALTDSSYYNEETKAYCYQGNASSNHEIVIVGWDDDYPAENFVGEVQENGAFLCLNSWGEEFGNSGAFYVSYEDANIGNYGITYSRVDPVGYYDEIFQADLCGYTAQIGYGQESAWFANVYTAEEPINARACGFYATGADTYYEIYGIREFTGPESFLLKEPLCSGYLEDVGYYTIDLPEPLKINEQTDFAFVVKITTEDALYPVAVECPIEGFSENADISDGRGYLSCQGSRWEQVETNKEYNLCLKIYADLQTSEK